MQQTPTDTPSGNLYLLKHEKNFLTFGKAISTDTNASKQTTNLRGSSNKGLVFSSGKTLNENGSDGTDLVLTTSYPDTQSIDAPRAKGHSIYKARGMQPNEDSFFAAKLSFENKHTTLDSDIICPSSTPKLPILTVNNKENSPTSIDVAMVSPIYMGRIDSNDLDTAYPNAKGLYLLNTAGLSEGGILHKLKHLHTKEPQVELGQVFRFAGLQTVNVGALYRVPNILHWDWVTSSDKPLNFPTGDNNPYNYNSGIISFARIYNSNAKFDAVTPTDTIDNSPIFGSNYLDGRNCADNSQLWYPKEIVEEDGGNTTAALMRDGPVKELREVWELHDPSYQNYDLFATGGLFTDSYLRAENLFGNRLELNPHIPKTLTSYSLILTKEGTKSKSTISHTNYKGISNTMYKEDKDYDYLNISSIDKDMYPFRFSLIRLTELCVDWHFNLTNPVNITEWGKGLVKACGQAVDRQGNNSDTWKYTCLSGFHQVLTGINTVTNSVGPIACTGQPLNNTFDYTGAYIYTDTGYFVGKVASVSFANPHTITFTSNPKRAITNSTSVRIFLRPQNSSAVRGTYNTITNFKFRGADNSKTWKTSKVARDNKINFNRVFYINEYLDASTGFPVSDENIGTPSFIDMAKIAFGPISESLTASPFFGVDRWDDTRNMMDDNIAVNSGSSSKVAFYYQPSKIVSEMQESESVKTASFFSDQNEARRLATGIRGKRNLYHGMHITLFNSNNWGNTMAGVAGRPSRGMTTYVGESSLDVKNKQLNTISTGNPGNLFEAITTNVSDATNTLATFSTTSSGAGAGATITALIQGNTITAATINSVGTGDYKIGDTLIISSGSLGSTSNAVFTLTGSQFTYSGEGFLNSPLNSASGYNKSIPTIGTEIQLGNPLRVFAPLFAMGLPFFSNTLASMISGRQFTAEALFKPTIPDSITGVTIGTTTTTIDTNQDNGLHWINFTPNLKGRYLMGVEGTPRIPSLPEGNIPSVDNLTETNVLYNRMPKCLVKIIDHSVNSGVHTLTYSETITVADVGGTWRVMMMNPITIPKGKQRINLFQYNNRMVMQDKDGLVDGSVSLEDFSFNERLNLSNEGIWEVYLPASIEQSKLTATNPSSHIVMTKIQDWYDFLGNYNSTFPFTNNPELYMTDGNNGQKVIFESEQSYMKFTDPIDKDYFGAVSFGEIITLSSDLSSSIKNPTHAYIAPKVTICDEVEKVMEDLLESNDIVYELDKMNLQNTFTLVDTFSESSKTITTHSTVSELEGIFGTGAIEISVYNENQEIIGLVTSITNSGGAGVLNLSTWRNSPAVNDILYMNVHWPYFIGGTLSGDNLLSALDYLSGFKDISVVAGNDQVNFEKETTTRISKADLSYKNPNTYITSSKSSKSIFSYANKIIVYGDGVKTTVSKPDNRKVKTLTYYNDNIKTKTDARIKAEILLDLHSVARTRINIKVNRKGLEYVDVGDIITLNFPQQEIPKNEYMIVEIKETFSDSLELEVVENEVSLSERLSELLVSSKKSNAKSFTKNVIEDIETKRGYDDFDLIPQSLTVRHNVTGNTGFFGFTPLFGFTTKFSNTPIISTYTEIDLV
jgi:hypothetical protein